MNDADKIDRDEDRLSRRIFVPDQFARPTAFQNDHSPKTALRDELFLTDLQLLPFQSLVAERPDRIDMGCAMSRQITGEKRDPDQTRWHHHEGERIVRP